MSAILFGNAGDLAVRVKQIQIGCSNARAWNDDEYIVETHENLIFEGIVGAWSPFVEMDEGYLACGAQVQYKDT